jgi:3-hydroxybutyryl-CoA dehydratase
VLPGWYSLGAKLLIRERERVRMVPKRFEEIHIGAKEVFSKTITEADIFAFAGITGDFNPIHVNAEFARMSIFKQRVAHGMLTAGLIDNTLTNIGGVGTIHLSQSVKFLAPVFIGDTVTVTSEVVSKDEAKGRVVIKSAVNNQTGKIVLEGEALLMVPREKGKE